MVVSNAREDVVAGEIVTPGTLIIKRRHLPLEVARALKALPRRVSNPRGEDLVFHQAFKFRGMRVVFAHTTRGALGDKVLLFEAAVKAIREKGLVAEMHREKYNFEFDRVPHHFVLSVENGNLKVIPVK